MDIKTSDLRAEIESHLEDYGKESTLDFIISSGLCVSLQGAEKIFNLIMSDYYG